MLGFKFCNFVCVVNDANIPPDIHCKALYEMYEDLTDLDFESLLPHMKNQGIVSKEAEWHLRSDHISPMRKLQIMMNDLTGPGKKMAESVFLCLLDCHESCHNHTDVPFTLANALKRAGTYVWIHNPCINCTCTDFRTITC